MPITRILEWEAMNLKVETDMGGGGERSENDVNTVLMHKILKNVRILNWIYYLWIQIGYNKQMK